MEVWVSSPTAAGEFHASPNLSRAASAWKQAINLCADDARWQPDDQNAAAWRRSDRAMSLRLVGVAGGVGCGLGGGVVAEADSDRLVVAALFGVDEVG
jgi:hypothetical protein